MSVHIFCRMLSVSMGLVVRYSAGRHLYVHSACTLMCADTSRSSLISGWSRASFANAKASFCVVYSSDTWVRTGSAVDRALCAHLHGPMLVHWVQSHKHTHTVQGECRRLTAHPPSPACLPPQRHLLSLTIFPAPTPRDDMVELECFEWG